VAASCLACSTNVPEASGKFCPACGAELEDLGAAETGRGFDSGEGGAAASMVGTVVDGFVFQGVLGGGAFGTVYRGLQVGLDRPVAIKVPTMEIASDPLMARRFGREARAAARVQHPGVVTIYAVGELPDGRPYLAMELLEGVPLDRILADGPLPPPRALRIARAIASALVETHAVEVVHRDLKPSNVMWRCDRTGDDRITLVDFGIAVCKPGNADATRLTAGGLIGTPHYMSPEQAHGEVVDARADLYALGCLLFELLTGNTPFDGSGYEVMLAHLGRPPPSPSDRAFGIPAVVDELVLSLLTKRPEDRVQSAADVVAAIDRILAPARKRTATDSEVTERSAAPSRARWVLVGAGTALALAGGALAVARLGVSDSRAATEERDPGTPQPRREIFRDDGETRLRLWVPDPFVVGRQRLRVELRNKLGAPILADQLIVTIEDPEHRATGITARPRQENPEQFGFGHDYKVPGRYRLRVFPPENAARSPSTFELDLDVR
jgi:hypothetical protein